jgi:hypothetical protein
LSRQILTQPRWIWKLEWVTWKHWKRLAVNTLSDE